MAKLAFLGTGLIGAGLAEAAARRGEDVTAWNRTAAKVQPLAAHGVRLAASPAEAARGTERVHLALTDDAALDEVLAALGPVPAIIVDHTTASPAGTAARAASIEAAGGRYLHAPVFMSPRMCREAGGVMLAAGPRALFDEVEPALGRMTGKLAFVGERRDLAAAYKLFGNALILLLAGGLADVYAMASALGIPATDAHGLFSLFNPAATILVRGGAMARGDYAPSFELAMARKDARLMEEIAPGALTLLPALAARMDELVARGLGAKDLGVLAIDAVPATQRQAETPGTEIHVSSAGRSR